MSTDKEMMKKSVTVLVDTAAGAAKLAKLQRETADMQNDTAIQQHATAHKLENLSETLAQGAADLKQNLKEVPKVA